MVTQVIITPHSLVDQAHPHVPHPFGTFSLKILRLNYLNNSHGLTLNVFLSSFALQFVLQKIHILPEYEEDLVDPVYSDR
jgi:hypothetical protein